MPNSAEIVKITLFKSIGKKIELSPKKLHEELRLKYYNVVGDPKTPKFNYSLEVDLSKMQWINTYSLVELILFIEYLIIVTNRKMLENKDSVKHSFVLKSIVVRFPNPEPFQNEKLPKNDQRKRVLDWLEVLQLERALQFDHLEGSFKVNIFKYQNESNPKNPKVKQNKEEKIIKKIIPLIWIKKTDTNTINKDYIKSQLGDTISQNDAEDIADVIVYQLIENVANHSKREHALICATVQKYPPNKTEHYYEKKFFTSSPLDNEETFLELVFGDSGEGIIATLKSNPVYQVKSDQFVIQESFDRWSSKKPYLSVYDYIERGTRGLYKIRRIAQKYDGMVAVRSNVFYFGHDDLFGEDIDPHNELCRFNGTIVIVRLLPKRKTVLKYNPSFSKQIDSKVWDRVLIKYDDEKIEKESFKEIAEKAPNNLLISISHDLSKEYKFEFLKNIIKELTYLRHPNLYIIYGIPKHLGSNSIKGLINKIDIEIKNEISKDKNKKSDPVIIIESNAEMHIVGTNDFSAELFESLIKPKINKINYDYTNVIEHLKQDPLFLIDNAEISLAINQSEVIEYLRREILILIKNEIEKNKVIISPNLKKLRGWLNVKEIFNRYRNEIVISFAALWNKRLDWPGKTDKIIDETQVKINNIKNVKILVENENEVELGQMLLNFLNIPLNKEYSTIVVLSEEFDQKRQRRVELFEKTDEVIILTSIVSTKETCTKLLKSVLRSNATPVYIFSLLYMGDICEEIEVWSQNVRFASVFEYNLLLDVGTTEASQVIQPKTFKPDPISLENITFKIDAELRNRILESRSLHFSHIGKPNDRHFTFYFSATRFLDQKNFGYKNPKSIEDFIWDKFRKVILNWLIENKLSEKVQKDDKNNTNDEKHKIEIWYSEQEFKTGHPAQKIGEIICNKLRYNYDVTLVSISRTPHITKENKKCKNVIIVDWGVMTGGSLNKYRLKALHSGVENLLFCIFLNQMNSIEKEQVQVVSNLKNSKNDLKISSEFIYDFPLTCFESSEECSICGIREDLYKFDIEGGLLSEFAYSRRQALKIKPRILTNNEPNDPYSQVSESPILMDQEFILTMFEIKTLLQKCENDTNARLLLKVMLLKILESNPELIVQDEENNRIDFGYQYYKFIGQYGNIDILKDYIFDSRENNSFPNALIYFLSLEIYWIQRAPLNTSEVRTLLTQICKIIILEEIEQKDDEKVRNKFAAITVLRSCDKSMFIDSLSEMVKSNFTSSFESNSIKENIIYHSISFAKKGYHSSDDIIKKLDEQYENICKSLDHQNSYYKDFNRARWQINNFAIEALVKRNAGKLTKSAIVKECLMIFEGEKKYNLDHSLFTLSIINATLPINLKGKAFLNFNKNYRNDWNRIINFISPITLFLSNLSSIIFSEHSRLRNYRKYLNLYQRSNMKDIYEILDDITKISDLENYQKNDITIKYNTLLNEIIELFHSRDDGVKISKIEEFLNLLHVNIEEIIDKVSKKYSIIKVNKGKGENKVNELNINVFYNFELFEEFIEQIFSNALERKITSLVPIIDIRLTEKNIDRIIVTFIVKNTQDQKNSISNYKIAGGGLQKHKDLSNLYEGKILSSKSDDDDFIITAEFLKYDK
ncbi:MAG: hypothetical protein KA536_10315 [Saprospiraceae bacterium]|nr:hypothetical protein [Saprospiraceae bacterium]